MICPECGAENSPNRHFCYVCAAPLTPAARGQPVPTPPPTLQETLSPTAPPSVAAPRLTPTPPIGQHTPPRSPAAPTPSAPRRSGGWLWLVGAAVLALVAFVAIWQLVGSRGAGGPGEATPPPLAKVAAPRSTVPPPPRVRAGEILNVPRAARPPVLDGRLADDWGGEGYPVAYAVFGADQWHGPTDLSGRLWFAWDDQNFYVASAVVDDVFSQPSRGETLYLGDSVEIQWDVDLQGDFTSDTFDGDDWHIGLTPGNFRDAPPEAHVWAPRAQTGAAAGIHTTAQRVSTGDGRQGYTLEAAIPWALLGLDPRGGQAFGFAFSISDNDSQAAAQQSLLSTSAQREWHRPTTFNTLILQP